MVCVFALYYPLFCSGLLTDSTYLWLVSFWSLHLINYRKVFCEIIHYFCFSSMISSDLSTITIPMPMTRHSIFLLHIWNLPHVLWLYLLFDLTFQNFVFVYLSKISHLTFINFVDFTSLKTQLLQIIKSINQLSYLFQWF